jgi:hypothetical protein
VDGVAALGDAAAKRRDDARLGHGPSVDPALRPRPADHR